MIQLAKVKVDLAESKLKEHEKAYQLANQLPTKAQYKNFVADYKNHDDKFFDGDAAQFFSRFYENTDILVMFFLLISC